MAQHRRNNSAPHNLASLLDLDCSPQRIWNADELAALFRHQLSASVQFDLGAMSTGDSRKLAALADAQSLLVRSFGDLLSHPNPPIELLVMLKDFAKANASHPDSALPSDVARVLYYLAISVALVRCRQRITQTTDEELVQSLRWAVALPWIQPPQREIMTQAMSLLSS